MIPVSALTGDNVIERSTEMPLVPRADRARVADVLAAGAGRGPRGHPVPAPGAVHRARRRLPRLRRHGGRRLGPPGRQGRRQRQGRDRPRSSGSWSAARTSRRPTPTSAVVLTLETETDVTRGDLLVAPAEGLAEDQYPRPAVAFAADLVWTGEEELRHGRSYLLLAGSLAVPAVVTAIRNRRDVVSGEEMAARTLEDERHRPGRDLHRHPGAARPLRRSAGTPAASCSSSGSAATPWRPGWCGTRCAARTTSCRTPSPSTARRGRR